jgi:ferredoxin/flavodoxin---NADP+ reductase
MAEASDGMAPNGASDAAASDGRDVVDILIIGGGPTGLFAAFYSGLRGATSKIVDSLEELGGQVTAMYPEKYIYDVGGFPAILGKDLIANLAEQAGQFHPQIRLSERAAKLERIPDDEVFRLETDKGVHFGKAVIVCGGIGAFAPKKLTLEGLEAFERRGDIVYFVTRNEDFRDKDVLIVGGGDSAVDWALTLEPIARRLTLIHRSDNFRAHAKSVEQMMGSRVDVHTYCEAEALHQEAGRLRAVTFKHNKTGETNTVEVDRVIMSIGFLADLGPLKSWGLEVQKNQVVADPLTMATNLPGVWAAGDIVTHPTKFKLIATGFHEAITAVNHAVVYINPKQRLSAAHSTNLELPIKAQTEA